MILPAVSDASIVSAGPDDGAAAGRAAAAAAPPAVLMEDVSVRFQMPRERAGSLKEHLLRRPRANAGPIEHEALRDVSLAIPAGEALGVIGSNGSGKTTLLRLMARVLRPSSGRVRVRGRVAPILDLVGGFHPELTGRENIIFNGTLLGLRRHDIAARIDSIVDFAEIGAFIDAPLRTYSAGMMLRLGFAVATDIEPDILVIDEALAVGDEYFQRKCAARIDGLRARGITFVLVSHDPQSVRRLCTRVMWLDRGRARMIGHPAEVLAAYHAAQVGRS
jgi:ABC-type polysaccharide/polyol phosphate transport system ATPase subunit